MSSTTCGDYGGRTAAGEPCQRPRREGRCPDHSEEAAELVGELQKRLLALWEEEPLKGFPQVCDAVGVSTSTAHRWREQDESFEARYREVKLAVDRARLSSLEESLYERVQDGKASAGLEIFTLVNLSNRISRATGEPPRWEHRQRIELEAQLESRGEISLSALRAARQELERNEERSISSPWESSEKELPESIPSPWEDRAEPPQGNGAGGASES